MRIVKYLDDPLHKLLNLIIDKYYNNKKAIIILSDHREKLPDPYW